MHEPKLYEKEKLLKDLQEIGSKLPHNVTVYLIGGCAMCLRGLKGATKDVDAIFTLLEDLRLFEKELSDLGYHQEAKVETVYDQLGAYTILRHPEKAGFDLFHIQVCNMLLLSESMKKRATKYADMGKLTVYLLANEDITLFKGITERPKDIVDMAALVQAKETEKTAFDWNVIKEECKTQAEELKIEGHLYNRLLELFEKYQIRAPLLSWLKNRDRKHLFEEVCRRRLEKGLTHEQIVKQFRKDGFSKVDIALVERLVKKKTK